MGVFKASPPSAVFLIFGIHITGDIPHGFHYPIERYFGKDGSLAGAIWLAAMALTLDIRNNHKIPMHLEWIYFRK